MQAVPSANAKCESYVKLSCSGVLGALPLVGKPPSSRYLYLEAFLVKAV